MSTAQFEFPEDKRRLLKRAYRIELVSLVYLASSTILMALVLGQSQAMKTAWLDNVFSFLPALMFFVGTHIARWPATKEFPYGYHNVISVCYLASAAVLMAVGIYLAVEAVWKLFEAEHPTIGVFQIAQTQFWFGWLMIAVLAAIAIPVFFIGRAKAKVARALYDKVLFTDAEIDRADWLTEASAIAGIIGIGIGLWWADAVAALLIAVEIMHDGFRHLRLSTFELIDRRPYDVEGSDPDPTPTKIKDFLCGLPWVRDADVKLRTSGHVFQGDAYVVPRTDEHLTQNISQARDGIMGLDWRMSEIGVTPVPYLPSVTSAERQQSGEKAKEGA